MATGTAGLSACLARLPATLMDTRPARLRRRRSAHEYMRQLGWRALWLIATHGLRVWAMSAAVRAGTPALPLDRDIARERRSP